MKNPGKRLSIFSQPEVKEVYSIPRFEVHERDYFFTFTDAEFDVAKGHHSQRNRIHFLLMLGYFKVKPVCLVYGWNDIEDDYKYIVDRYYPKTSKQKKNSARHTRSRLYKKLFDVVDYKRCNKVVESELSAHLKNRAKVYVGETQLFKDAINWIKLKTVAIPLYSTLQLLISCAINTEETRLAKLINQHLSDKTPFLRLIDSSEKTFRLRNLKKLTKSYQLGESHKELSRHNILSVLSGDALSLMEKLRLSEGNVRDFATRCKPYNIFQASDS